MQVFWVSFVKAERIYMVKDVYSENDIRLMRTATHSPGYLASRPTHLCYTLPNWFGLYAFTSKQQCSGPVYHLHQMQKFQLVKLVKKKKVLIIVDFKICDLF